MAERSDAIAAIDLSFPSANSLAEPAVSAEMIGWNLFLLIIFWHWPMAWAWLLTNLMSLMVASGLQSKLCSTFKKYSPWICN